MKRRWLATIAILVLLAIAGAGLGLAGVGSHASTLATPAAGQRQQARTTATVPATAPAVTTPIAAASPTARSTPSREPARSASPVAATAATTATATTAPAPTLPIAQAKPAPALPVRLIIPKLGIDAPIESVGLAANGNMAVPSTWESTGWYNRGPRPGDFGNAVIDGHLDSYTGPAIFWHLRDLQSGDKVLVKTADGAILQFIVTGSQAFGVDSFPGQRIFGPAASPQLNLITCDGDWDSSQGQYNQRLVVFTKLVPAG